MKLLIAVLLSSALVVAPVSAQRRYWDVSLDSLALGRVAHSHVAVRGVIAFVGHESDQDQHNRLCSLAGTGRCIVGECIPELPCLLPNGLPWIPAVGDTVTLYGIPRKDLEHGWWEVHPIEAVTP